MALEEELLRARRQGDVKRCVDAILADAALEHKVGLRLVGRLFHSTEGPRLQAGSTLLHLALPLRDALGHLRADGRAKEGNVNWVVAERPHIPRHPLVALQYQPVEDVVGPCDLFGMQLLPQDGRNRHEQSIQRLLVQRVRTETIRVALKDHQPQPVLQALVGREELGLIWQRVEFPHVHILHGHPCQREEELDNLFKVRGRGRGRGRCWAWAEARGYGYGYGYG